jgi:hypothetical protein
MRPVTHQLLWNARQSLQVQAELRYQYKIMPSHVVDLLDSLVRFPTIGNP